MGLLINTCGRRLIPPRNFGFICVGFGGGVSKRENYAVEGEYNSDNFLRSDRSTHRLNIKVSDMINNTFAPPVVLHDVGYITCWITWCPGEDSNFHDHNGHWHLKPARLPIPPPGHRGDLRNLTDRALIALTIIKRLNVSIFS